ncbi:MAG: PKD domain-containing protein [Flavobacteriales bacterium]|nr:PKD domain-containing protein [Flavobacteriales bacterium]MCX7768406.1 PKD domain-containing protein [Flavobacteriales bacterium]MDW8409701.1 PKD domain-containing protein [Flavobacteriales bacterium]
MGRVFFLISAITGFSVLANSQKSIVLQHPSPTILEAEDARRAAEGLFPRCAVGLPVSDFDPTTVGSWELLSDGMVQWHFKVAVPGARGMALYFDRLILPPGGRLRVECEACGLREEVTAAHLDPSAGWLSEFFPTEELSVQYVGPSLTPGVSDIHLDQVAVAYRMLHFPFFPRISEKDFGDADGCQVNARCSPEGDNWHDQRRSVVRILVKEGNYYGWCSGAMVNNTAQDCTPYVLTANHCGAGASVADFKSWKYYFNYESSACANPPGEGTLATQTVTGSLKVASSSDASTVTKSDFLLTILKMRPPASYNAYLAGWSTSNTGSSSGVTIHHPAGDIKKISTYTQALLSATWGGTPGTHWQVKWTSTTNGHGVTEEGSSGSPLFNSSKLVIGHLSGGSSFCTQPNNPDYYGKLWYSWDQTGTTANRRLKNWLDRANTNPTTLSGRNNNCSTSSLPTVDFVADKTNVMAGEEVSFTDLTTGNPFAWTWQVSPTTFSFSSGTSATSQNPKMKFNNQGNYTITLTAANTAGYETKVRTAYIKVTGNISTPEGFDESIPTVSFIPNPAVDRIEFFTDWDRVGNVRVSVTDLSGRILQTAVLSRETSRLNFSFQGQGLFLVRITSDNQPEAVLKLVRTNP